jgi:hypothetical protein
VITGTEDGPHALVALTRGTDVNLAYVFTRSPKQADPVPGPRPAPELARYDRLTAGPGDQTAPAAPTGEALSVLAGVLERGGQQLSATQTRQQALADADHLAVLHAIWTAETTPARHQHYTGLLLGALRPATAPNPATRPDGCGGPCAPPNSPGSTPGRSWPARSPNGTWPESATSPPSSTPAYATGPARSSLAQPDRGPPGYPRWPISSAAPTSARSPR